MKKRGFTLIELLAVIIILAIIALIATPIIMRVIENSKKSASKLSIQNYLHAIETKVVAYQMDNEGINDGTYRINSDGDICLDKECNEKLEIKMNGNKPTGGRVTIKDLKVDSAMDLYLDAKYYSYANGILTSSTTRSPGGYTASGNYISWDDLKKNKEYITLSGKTISSVSQTFKDEITTLVIPEDAGITSIGNQVFRDCTSLTSITIPEGVTSIGEHVFFGCSSLESISLPSTLTSIGRFAFYRCTSLSSFTIPEGVTSIGTWAFYGCTSLSSITIPERITSIEDYMFCGCKSLSSFTIPEGVTRIGTSAFQECGSLTSITIPGSVTSIGKNAFYLSKLSSVTFNNQPSGTSWQVCTSADATSGTDVDITDAGINANNLRSNHRSEYWKRFGA